MVNVSAKVAIVTGGSVGKELARGFLEAGANVAFIYRNPARGALLTEWFADFPDSFLPLQADLVDPEQAKQSVSATTDRFGGVDFLLNSLGGWLGGKRLHEHTNADLQKMLSIDLVPTFNIMAAVLPVMAEQKFGRVVNFISTQVFTSGGGNSVYTASKAALLALTRAAAEEYKSSGISVNALAPSTIDTESNRKAMPAADFGKWVKPGELVDAALFLCGSENSLNDTILKFPGR